MSFHRFVSPSYNLGGGSFPGTIDGFSYDLSNVVSGGTGSGGSAFADGPKVGGPNSGTYWHAHGEDATSSFFNRGLKALTENTDRIDDLLHRDLSVPAATAYVTSAGQTNVLLIGEIWLSYDPATPIKDLFSLVDENNRQIINNTTGNYVYVSSISLGGTVGDGFSSSGGVTVAFSEPITSAHATSWRVIYGERSTLSVLPADAFTKTAIRTASEIDAFVEKIIKLVKFDQADSSKWYDSAPKNLNAVAYSGLDQLYRMSTSASGSAPSWWPVSPALNIAGAGGYYVKGIGPCVTGYAGLSTNYYTQAGYGIGATWLARNYDSFTHSSNASRFSMSSGFIRYGRSFRTYQEIGSKCPTMYGFGNFIVRSETTAGVTTSNTHLLEGASLSLGGDLLSITSPGSWFARSGNTSIQVGLDVLTCEWVDAYISFVVTEIVSDTSVRVRYVDGSNPNTGGGCVLEHWLAPTFLSTDNAPALNSKLYGDSQTGNMIGNGTVFSMLPRIYNTYDPGIVLQPAVTLLCSDDVTPLVWKSFDYSTGTYVGGGALTAAGGATFHSHLTFYVEDTNLLAVASESGSASMPKSRWYVFNPDTSVNFDEKTWNARYSTSLGNYSADLAYDGTPGGSLRVRTSPWGIQVDRKGDTSSAWTSWDSNGASFCMGHKYLIIPYDNLAYLQFPVQGAWTPATYAVGTVQVSFTSVPRIHPSQTTPWLCEAEFVASSLEYDGFTSNEVVEFRLEYEWDGSGTWTEVDGSYTMVWGNSLVITGSRSYLQSFIMKGTFVVLPSGSSGQSDLRVRLAYYKHPSGTLKFYGPVHLNVRLYSRGTST